MNRSVFSGFAADSPSQFVSQLLDWPDGNAPHTNPPGGVMTLIVDHGLGAVPRDVRWVLVNYLPEIGYNPGDELTGLLISDGLQRWSFWANASQVGAAFENVTYQLHNKLTAARTNLAPAKWKFRVYARR